MRPFCNHLLESELPLWKHQSFRWESLDGVQASTGVLWKGGDSMSLTALLVGAIVWLICRTKVSAIIRIYFG